MLRFLKKLLGRGIDFTQPVFYSVQYRPHGYDKEIDEGMSSGLTRLATLDVTKLSEDEISHWLHKISNSLSDYNVCKVIQIMGFTKGKKRYIAISGEAHMLHVVMASKQIKETREFPKGCKFVDYVKAPGKRKPFKTVDYGPYGSTGAPMYGIKKHPKAP